jgi:glycosyltransferase involved in cell wall biosynthesis
VTAITILTPSLNQLGHIKRCVASVRDQQVSNARIQHWVLDAGSTDGTVDWLNSEGISYVSEPDRGMYHALNKGLSMIRADDSAMAGIWAWLNADEQYLESSLSSILDVFQKKPSVDVVSAGALIIDSNGRLLTHRKSLPLRAFYMRAGLYNFSCATFFRGRVLQHAVQFNDSLTATADSLFIADLLRKQCKSACLNRFVSTYTFAAHNISNQPHAVEEYRNLISGSRFLLACAKAGRSIERILRRTRHVDFPVTYAIYRDPNQPRYLFQSDYVSSRWPRLERHSQ